MSIIQISRIQVRRGEELQTGVPQLEPGEFAWAQDTENLYIGKRINEGASDDSNTRILTENDLNYFKLLSLNNTSTAASIYQYRNGILAGTTVTTIQAKLDSLNPSLIDFGVRASTGTYVQIDAELSTAIDELFANANPLVRGERRRVLEIPAGLFYLTSPVKLPPYTKLVGAGPGLTKIQYRNSLTNMFFTADALGNNWNTGMTSLSTGSSRDVTIEGMTLEFSNSLTGARSLISLDNVTNATVENCVFRTQFNELSTTTYGIVSYGVGVQIRGQGDNGTEKCRNVTINNCEFNGLLTGVWATGTVVTPSIRYSRFSNLDRGVVLETHDSLQGPVNGYIAYNRFQDILKEGIYVGANPNTVNSSHLSTQNYFSRVGGLNLNEFTNASSVTSVISFYSPGNKSVDDYFARRAYADSLTNLTGFYYNPYVRGTTTIADSAVYTKNITVGTNKFVRIPINNGSQMATVNYQLYNSNQSRKGTILANITAGGSVAITDTYNYIETLKEDISPIVASTGSNINLLIVDASTYPRFAQVQSDLQIGNSVWFLTGSNYSGKAAFITEVLTSGTQYRISTDSADPAFNFWSGGTWTLLKSESAEVAMYFNTDELSPNNFISLTAENPSTATTFTLDYQIDIQT